MEDQKLVTSFTSEDEDPKCNDYYYDATPTRVITPQMGSMEVVLLTGVITLITGNYRRLGNPETI